MKIIDLGLQFGSLSQREKTNRIILHHADAQVCGAQLIHQWHRQNGWSGCGYHYVVRKNGSVETGRPENTIGAHAQGSNSDSIGICFEGDYDIEKEMPAKQKAAGQWLVAYMKRKYGISKVQRHSDTMATACPGKYFPFDEIAGAVMAHDTDVKIENASAGMEGKLDSVKVGNETHMSNIKNDIAELQEECNKQGFSSQKVDGIPGPITLAGCPMLKKGSEGNITKWLQNKINSLGYSCGVADGIFGANTKKGVIAFQNAKGLIADGIVGVKTWSKLLGLS